MDGSWWISSFPIVREPNCDFRYWKRDGNVLQLAGRTGPLPLSFSLENPSSIHIALTSNPSEMTVQFTTGAVGKPVVEYGHSNGNIKVSDFPMRADGTSTTYAASDMCQEPANVTEAGKFIDPGQLHTVILTNLDPDMEYLYRVGLSYGQGIVWSSTLAFRSALPPGWKEPYSFISYGDQGCPDDCWALGGNLTASMVRRELDGHPNRTIPTRLVHHFGDLSYARGSAYLWDSWLDMVQPFASRIPLMVGIGNHEYDHTTGGIGRDPSGVTKDSGFHPAWGNFRTDSGGECGVPTAKRFLMPKTQHGNYTSNGVFWYSYSFGLVHTIMISSEHDLSQDSPQHAWLQHELASVNRTATPWVVVESHRPMYHSKPYWADNAAAYLWDSWLDMVQPFASRIPLMVGIGNHEYDHTTGGIGRDPSGVTKDSGFHPAWGNFRTDSGGECGVPTAKRFLMPKTQHGNYTSNGVFWYSYSFGLVHTIMISSEHDLSQGSPQHAWLQHELASVNRTATPWVVVESHRPMYHSKPYWADNAVGIAMRAEFEGLLRKHRVDIFFAGHYHSYLRTCDGMYASKCHNGGPIHITVGTAGASLDDMSIGLYMTMYGQRSILEFGDTSEPPFSIILRCCWNSSMQ